MKSINALHAGNAAIAVALVLTVAPPPLRAQQGSSARVATDRPRHPWPPLRMCLRSCPTAHLPCGTFGYGSKGHAVRRT
jgi:hypothetical protein